MARPNLITQQTLTPLIRLHGPVSATDLAAALRVNRTTIVRGLANFGNELVTLGAARNTRYALRRPVGNAGNRWPIYRIDETGQSQPWAEVEALYERRWRITWASAPPAWAHHCSDREGMWQGYPFFLVEGRPQGFLGGIVARQLAQRFPLPQDPRTWNDDHTMLYLQAAGEDLPGALVVGDDCLRRAMQLSLYPSNQTTVQEDDCPTRYVEMAQGVAGTLPGSSAGGEQPKFLTTVMNTEGASHPVLVKFSPPMNQATGQRWADLLLCEFHAQAVLSAHSQALPGARIIDAGDRRFLEVPRFDRHGIRGRRNVISLGGIYYPSGGSTDHAWPTAIRELEQAGLVDALEVQTTLRLHAFGELIGNTDMHNGNLAFWMEDTLPFRVAPVYDMLPMLWAPGPQGEISPRQFAPAPPLPSVRILWQEAVGWALEFWTRVLHDPRLSPEFQILARAAQQTVLHLQTHA